MIPELDFSYDPYSADYRPGMAESLGAGNPYGGRNYMDPNAGYRAYQRSILREGEELDPRYMDVGSYYDNAASSTNTTMRNLRLAEKRAGRLIDPSNNKLIRFYVNRPTRVTKPPAVGIEALFTGLPRGDQFVPPEYFVGVPGRDTIPGTPTSRYSGRSGPSYTSLPEESVSISEGIAGMMGGGLVEQRTPFNKGRAMDRMVSEMTRNISRR